MLQGLPDLPLEVVTLLVLHTLVSTSLPVTFLPSFVKLQSFWKCSILAILENMLDL